MNITNVNNIKVPTEKIGLLFYIIYKLKMNNTPKVSIFVTILFFTHFISLESYAQNSLFTCQGGVNKTEMQKNNVGYIYASNIKSESYDTKDDYLLSSILREKKINMPHYMSLTETENKLFVASEVYSQKSNYNTNSLSDNLDTNTYNQHINSTIQKRSIRALLFKSVLTSDDIYRSTDLSVSQTTSRLPGIQKDSRGFLNIRGSGLNNYFVTIDGMRMATTGIVDRSYDLDILPADMVGEIEIIKIVTPDMDADGLGGIVNIIPIKSKSNERILNASLGGLANAEYLNETGLGSRATLTYSERPREDFSISLNINYQKNPQGWHSIGVDYDVMDFETEPNDILRSISPGLLFENRDIFYGGSQITYHPSNSSKYYLSANVINNSKTLDKHEHNWLTGDEWIDPSTPAEGEGIYQYNLQSREIGNLQYALNTGASHKFPFFSMDYNLGWSYSKTDQLQHIFPFEADGFNFSVEKNDRMKPQIKNIDELPNVGDTRLQIMNRIQNDQNENLYTGALNIEIPFTNGSFKLGSSANLTNMSVDFSDAEFQTLRFLDITNFDLDRKEPYDNMQSYYFPWTIDSEMAKSFFETSTNSFRDDDEKRRKISDIRNIKASENTYAGYGMATLEFNNLTFIGGARLEFTGAAYDGRISKFNPRGRYQSTSDTSQSVTHSHLFPHAQLFYNPVESARIGLAYSKTKARHGYDKLAPFELITPEDSSLYRGNPSLSPMISNNMDLFLDFNLAELSRFGISIFYKYLSGFIYDSVQSLDIQEGDIDGFEELFNEDNKIVTINDRQYKNSEETASVYGIELTWKQNFDFLPGYLSNLSTHANYTWSHSIFDSFDRENEVALPGQSPHVINLTFEYIQNRFSARASYHWTAPSIQSHRSKTSIAPAIDPDQPVYMDLYQDGWRDVSISMRYRVSNNIRVWIDAYNLFDVERVEYEHTRDLYPGRVDLNAGTGISAGIRYDL